MAAPERRAPTAPPVVGQPRLAASASGLEPPGVAELRPLRRGEALRLGPGWSHALLHAPHPGMRCALLMQMWFNGQLGFPGGFVDRRFWSLENGLNRVLGLGGVRLMEANYLASHTTEGPQRMVAHLYAKQLTLLELHAVEISAVHSRDHGLEVMGMVREPLYTQKDRTGLPSWGIPSSAQPNSSSFMP